MRNKEKKIILHIGTHKTGTSFIQKLLLENKKHLARHSIGLAGQFHPTLGHHHHLVNLIDRLEPSYEDFLSALRTENKVTIFSSECMLPWLMNHEKAPSLCEEVTNEWDAKVVIYLRRQDYMKESVFAEVATDWYQGGIQDENHYCYNYLRFIQRLEELFGPKRLLVGIYRDNSHQDLAQDFLRLTELDCLTQGLKRIPPARVSANRTQVALLAKCSKENSDVLDQVKTILESTGIGQQDTFKYQLSPEDRCRFLHSYIESNRLITRLYCPDAEEYMTAATPNNEEWQPIPALDIDDASQAISQLALLLQNKSVPSLNL